MMTEEQEAHIRCRMKKSFCDRGAVKRRTFFMLESPVLTLEDLSAPKSRKVSGAAQINLTYIQIKQESLSFFAPKTAYCCTSA